MFLRFSSLILFRSASVSYTRHVHQDNRGLVRFPPLPRCHDRGHDNRFLVLHSGFDKGCSLDCYTPALLTMVVYNMCFLYFKQDWVQRLCFHIRPAAGWDVDVDSFFLRPLHESSSLQAQRDTLSHSPSCRAHTWSCYFVLFSHSLFLHMCHPHSHLSIIFSSFLSSFLHRLGWCVFCVILDRCWRYVTALAVWSIFSVYTTGVRVGLLQGVCEKKNI